MGQVGPAAVSVADAVAADVVVIAETNDVARVVVFLPSPTKYTLEAEDNSSSSLHVSSSSSNDDGGERKRGKKLGRTSAEEEGSERQSESAPDETAAPEDGAKTPGTHS